MYAASSHHRSIVSPQPARSPIKSCLKKTNTKKQHRVRFALTGEASHNASKLLAPPPRICDFSREPSGGRLQQLADCIRPAISHMWLACGVMGTYHTVLQPSSARMAILGMCFVLPASRTLVNHGIKQSVAKLVPTKHPLEYFVATAAASAGVYVGLMGSSGHKN